MKLLVPSIVLAGLVITSCATSKSFVNDDIYSVKPSELPIGESTADETSYASFKSRKQGNTNDRMTYADEMALQNRQNCLNQWRWYDGCGCSYSEWLRSSRYSPQNTIHASLYWGRPMFTTFYGHPYSYMGGYHYGVGYWGYNHIYMYPYNRPYGGWYGSGMGFGMGFPPYDYYGYGYYGGFGSYYGFGGYPYGYYGYGYGGYGYGGNMNGWSNTGNTGSSSSNVYRGPRGTVSSGHYNPAGRAASPANKVKSGRADLPSNGTTGRTPVSTSGRTPVSSNGITSAAGRQTVSREVSSREVISRTNSSSRAVSPPAERTNSSTITPQRATSGNLPSGVQRTSTPQSGRTNRSSEFQGSYPSRTATPSTNTRSNSGVTRGSSGINRSSGGFERSSAPAQNSGSMSSPSRGSSGMGSSSSGGGGRSGGSMGSGSSSGRR